MPSHPSYHFVSSQGFSSGTQPHHLRLSDTCLSPRASHSLEMAWARGMRGGSGVIALEAMSFNSLCLVLLQRCVGHA